MIKKNENNKNISGNLIKKIREEKKITKTKLSLKLELMAIYLSRHDIYKIEKNDLPVKDFELIGIAKVLDINLNELKALID